MTIRLSPTLMGILVVFCVLPPIDANAVRGQDLHHDLSQLDLTPKERKAAVALQAMGAHFIVREDSASVF